MNAVDYLAIQTAALTISKPSEPGALQQSGVSNGLEPAPLVTWTKTRIVEEALRLGVPISDTWSCYSGGDAPCGICDSCRIRDAALREAGRPDLCS